MTVRQVSPEGAIFGVFALSGELNVVGVSELVDVVVRVLEGGGRRLCLDLSGITWRDNGSVFTLLGIRHATTHVGGSLSLAATSGTVREAFYRKVLGELLPIPV